MAVASESASRVGSMCYLRGTRCSDRPCQPLVDPARARPRARRGARIIGLLAGTAEPSRSLPERFNPIDRDRIGEDHMPETHLIPLVIAAAPPSVDERPRVHSSWT